MQINSRRDKYFETTSNILNHYYLTNFNKAKINGGSILISGVHKNNRFYNILSNWNSKESFNICILYMSENVHDSMGHGDCNNLTIDFMNTIVLSKIKSIYNQDPDQFYLNLTKHMDNEQNYEDCFDSVFKIMYPALKKAWEEEKIVLKTDQIKIDK